MRIKKWKNRLSTSRMKQYSLLKQMHNIWVGAELQGAEFDRGRVCQGPSLSGAEMSRNPSQISDPIKNSQMFFPQDMHGVVSRMCTTDFGRNF